VHADGTPRRVARVTGAVFVVAALPKFLAFGWERDNFVRFGLPYAGAWVIAAGLIELAGGLALLRGRFVVPASLVLAATMAVAIVASGVLQGDVIPSLTVAPALLVALGWLLRDAARTAQSSSAKS
jgi:uncharacterized membrane protein YphA (DoxX/SURF4 family)